MQLQSKKTLRVLLLIGFVSTAYYCEYMVHDIIAQVHKIWDATPNNGRQPRDAVWQPVAGTRSKFFIYSAYLERRSMAAIRIIAVTSTNSSEFYNMAASVFCRVYLRDKRIIRLRTIMKTINENHKKEYSAMFVLCLLEGSGATLAETVGASVAIVSNTSPKEDPTNLLPVQDTMQLYSHKDSLHLCVAPLHSSYSQEDWLVEWFEMNLVLGASHFYLYNESFSATTGCVIENYRKQGLVTLLPWKLPLQNTEIWARGQLASINDCLYRSMASAKWLLVIDVDELALPRRERTLVAFLSSMQASYQPVNVPASLLFRNAFFYLQWEDEDTEFPLITSRKTYSTFPYKVKNRSKFVVWPQKVIEMGIHHMWKMVPGAKEIEISTDLGLLHHYRASCEEYNENCLTSPTIIDRTAQRWAKILYEQVTATTNEVMRVCLDPVGQVDWLPGW